MTLDDTERNRTSVTGSGGLGPKPLDDRANDTVCNEVAPEGFEPPTPRLWTWCSTIELRRKKMRVVGLEPTTHGLRIQRSTN